MVMSMTFQIQITTMSLSQIKHSLSTRLCISTTQHMTYGKNKIQLIHRLTQILWSSLTRMTAPIPTGMPNSSEYFMSMLSIVITPDHFIQSQCVWMSCLCTGFNMMATSNQDSMWNNCPVSNFSTRKAFPMCLGFLTQTLSYKGFILSLHLPMVQHKNYLVLHLFDQRSMEINGIMTGAITMWTCKCIYC